MIYQWLIEHKSIWIPLVLYVALNLLKRESLVTNADPRVRYVARLLENVLVLQWEKWGGTLKILVPPVNEDIEK